MKRLRKSIKALRGIVVLGFVAGITFLLFSVGGYYLLKDKIDVAKSNAAEINISGRQRLLTERIVAMSLAVANDRNQASREKFLDALITAIAQMNKEHQALINGSGALGVSGSMSPQVHSMYFQRPFDINRKITSYLDDARAFAAAGMQSQNPRNPHLTQLQSASDALISALNAVTQQYEDDTRLNASKTELEERAILVAELLALVLLLLVFWPLVRRIRHGLNRIIEAETYSKTITECMLNGLISIDGNGIVQSFNPASEDIFGYSANEVVGHKVNVLMAEPYRNEHDDYLKHYQVTGERRVIGVGRQVEGRRKDGTIFPIYLAVSEMKLEDRSHFIGIIHDITEDIQAKKDLIVAKEEAERASRAKDSFLATMSHEIRTPLSGMLGMLEVLSLTSLDVEQNKTLQAAWDSGRSLLRIVSDILDWSKIEEGKLAIVPHATAIPQLLQEVVNTYSRIASFKGLKLYQHVDERIAPAHLVDALRLSQVLNNFVSNAIKFTKHGEIEVRAGMLEKDNSGERICFSVRDTGKGIAKGVQQQMFESYKQESADTTRMYGGTGLGLSICRRLTELMDGKIGLESAPGKGSTFSITLTLPVSGAPGEIVVTPQVEVQQRAVEPLFRDGFHDGANVPMVLVVDDHPINRDLLSRQISLLGLRSDTAEDGHQGLEKWKDGDFALVITDCHMPELDGYGLSRSIRNIEATRKGRLHTPIIGWTANAVGDEAGLCRNAGMDDLLIKPTDMKRLRDMLAKWLGIANSEAPSSATTPDPTDRGQAGPIDYAELEKVVPDRAMHRQVLQDFIKHIRVDRDRLVAQLAQGERAEVERTAHRMKGSSGMVGAKAMADICAIVERAAREGEMGDAQSAQATLDVEIDRLQASISVTNGHA